VSALVEGNAQYKQVRLINVDWDLHKKAPIAAELNVKRRSTLVMFRDGEEVARVVAGTSKSDIDSMFEFAVDG